eukprot:7387267-Prymnesium_polylepis.2
MQNKLRRLRFRGGRFGELSPLAQEDFAHLPGLEPSPAAVRSARVCTSSSTSKTSPAALAPRRSTTRVPSPSLRWPSTLRRSTLRQGADSRHRAPQANHAAAARLRGAWRVHAGDDCGDCDRRVGAEVEAREEARRVSVRLGRARGQDSDGREDLRCALQAGTARVVAHHALPGPHDATMVLMCKRLLPEAEKREIFLQGASNFKLPKGHNTLPSGCTAARTIPGQKSSPRS